MQTKVLPATADIVDIEGVTNDLAAVGQVLVKIVRQDKFLILYFE